MRSKARIPRICGPEAGEAVVSLVWKIECQRDIFITAQYFVTRFEVPVKELDGCTVRIVFLSSTQIAGANFRPDKQIEVIF